MQGNPGGTSRTVAAAGVTPAPVRRILVLGVSMSLTGSGSMKSVGNLARGIMSVGWRRPATLATEEIRSRQGQRPPRLNVTASKDGLTPESASWAVALSTRSPPERFERAVERLHQPPVSHAFAGVVWRNRRRDRACGSLTSATSCIPLLAIGPREAYVARRRDGASWPGAGPKKFPNPLLTPHINYLPTAQQGHFTLEGGKAPLPAGGGECQQTPNPEKSPIFVAREYGQSQRMDRRPLAKKSVTSPG